MERTVPLRRGLLLNGAAQTTAIVRSQSVDDALRIAEIGNEQKMLAELVRRRIVKLGEIEGPLPEDQFRRLESDDFTRLQVAIELMDRELMAAIAAEFGIKGDAEGRPDGNTA